MLTQFCLKGDQHTPVFDTRWNLTFEDSNEFSLKERESLEMGIAEQ